MRRQSSLLASSLALFVAISTLTTIAQDAPPSSSVEVVYLWNGGVVETYDIDRTTGIPTLAGQTTLPLKGLTSIWPSADDHFLYVIGNNPKTNLQQLIVFPTDAEGVPSGNGIERFDYGLSYFTIDPNGRFAYGVYYENKSEKWNFLLFPINPETGIVQPPKLVAQESESGPCSQYFPGAPSVTGFSQSGDQLYEEWACASMESTYENFYFTRQIDPRTGGLGNAVETVSTVGDAEGGTSVSITPNAIVEFVAYDCCSVVVLPLTGGNPVFTCTAEMLEACGSALSISIDPEGKDIFFRITSDTVLIGRLLPDRIAATGYYMVGSTVIGFSPDDELLYAADNSGNVYWIYVFDPATGSIAQAPQGRIEEQLGGSGFVPALRR